MQDDAQRIVLLERLARMTANTMGVCRGGAVPTNDELEESIKRWLEGIDWVLKQLDVPPDPAPTTADGATP